MRNWRNPREIGRGKLVTREGGVQLIFGSKKFKWVGPESSPKMKHASRFYKNLQRYLHHLSTRFLHWQWESNLQPYELWVNFLLTGPTILAGLIR